MNDDEQAELVALTWLGRGDFTADEWSEALAAARERDTGPTSAYLLGIPILADYLEEGLSQFGLSCRHAGVDEIYQERLTGGRAAASAPPWHPPRCTATAGCRHYIYISNPPELADGRIRPALTAGAVPR